MFEATDGLISHTRQNTFEPWFKCDPTSWNSPARNRKTTPGGEAKPRVHEQEKSSSNLTKHCSKIKQDFYRDTRTDYLTKKDI